MLSVIKHLFEKGNYGTTDHMFRHKLKPGMKVSIVLKKDQGTNKRVIGTIEKLLTSKPRHTRGIKVRLVSGQVGRVQKIF